MQGRSGGAWIVILHPPGMLLPSVPLNCLNPQPLSGLQKDLFPFCSLLPSVPRDEATFSKVQKGPGSIRQPPLQPDIALPGCLHFHSAHQKERGFFSPHSSCQIKWIHWEGVWLHQPLLFQSPHCVEFLLVILTDLVMAQQFTGPGPRVLLLISRRKEEGHAACHHDVPDAVSVIVIFSGFHEGVHCYGHKCQAGPREEEKDPALPRGRIAAPPGDPTIDLWEERGVTGSSTAKGLASLLQGESLVNLLQNKLLTCLAFPTRMKCPQSPVGCGEMPKKQMVVDFLPPELRCLLIRGNLRKEAQKAVVTYPNGGHDSEGKNTGAHHIPHTPAVQL